MKSEQARALVTETFPQPFDKGRFHRFVKELLNGFDETKAAPMVVPDAFALHVRSCARLGTYESPDGELADVLIVHTTEPWKLERTRTALRDFVAHKLKRGNSYKEAGLVAFIAPDARSWRFSFVRMEYESKRDPKSGKIAVEERLTPARRFSYLVGENESCHTAQSRFLDLLQDTETKPPLAKIEEAFSVETVTKEFFEKYRALFEEIEKELKKVAAKDKTIRDELKERNVSTIDFAKKLMGQIVFLYFLQKKGWLGVARGKDWGTGPHDFFRRLARGDYGSYENFFHDILEPLFNDILATDRGHDAWCDRFKCRIPFLNGGLFEPLADYDERKTSIVLPDRLFTNTERFDELITGTGILDVFDRYNFTVNEAEPLEKEVAIDPEMLGKVFENLIEENRRKGLGSFYTPREIVHYQCQECLISYLDTAFNHDKEIVARKDIETFIRLGEQISHYEAVDAKYPIKMPLSIEKHARLIDEKLATITVCDPAVGSGAYPVGMMTEIVRARCALTPYFNAVHERTSYHFKRHTIQNCLYGVDIDPGAVEIAKLRLWLSLVVDEVDVKQIKPLPNLDFKIVTGNSLIGFPFKSQRLEEIEKLKPRFFEEADHERKAKLKQEIDQKLTECFASSNRSLGYEVNFDFEIYFSEVFHANGGFDAVIANPPYIDSETMTKESPQLRQLIQASYSLTKGNWDIYIAFYEKGFTLLASQGVISFITPDKWISKPFGDQLRSKTTDRVFSILKAGRSVFESATVDAIVTVFVNRPQPLLRIYDYAGTQISLKRIIAKDTLKSPYAYDWLFSDFLELLAKIGTHSGRLAEYGLCENACATSDAYKLKEFIEEEPKDAIQSDYLQIINTGTIGKFISKWGRREMVYLGDKYSRPVVNKKQFLAAFRNSYGQKATKPKLILKGLNLLDGCLDSEGTTIPGKTTLLITSSNLETLKFLAAILNSSVPFFYLKEKYPASSYNQGTTFTKEMFNDLPIPEIKANDREKLVSSVDKIVVAKQRDALVDTSAVEREIDELVYALYGLTDEEKALVQAAAR